MKHSILFLSFLAVCHANAGELKQPTVRDVSTKKQLFIDHRFIDSSTNVLLVMNPPRLAGAALEPGPAGSWDDAKVTWGQVAEDEGIFKMWAGGFSAKALKGDWKELEVHTPMGYATSTDGIQWSKPKLGIHDWNGNKDNNITSLDLGYVMIDPKGNKAERYKLLCTGATQIGAKDIYEALNPKTGGLYFYTSADGRHWNWNPKQVFPFHPDTLNQIDYEPRIGRYVVYIRAWPHGFLFKKTYGRTVGRLEIEEPISQWPYDDKATPVKPWGPKYIATPGKEIPTVLSFPGFTNEGVWTDVYNPCVSTYPWAEDAYFAFPSLNHYLADSTNSNDSTLNIGMAVSRDGVHWQWPSTETYIASGKVGGGRSGQLYQLVGMLKVGDQIFQYHAATDLRHNINWSKDYTLEQLRNVGRIYRTVQRMDGFVSADFPAGGGEFTTPLLKFSGRKLRLNLDAAKGLAQVELLNAIGVPVQGFELSACKKIQSDSIRQLVSWKKGSDLSALQGEPVRLRIKGQNAKLYAFQFAD